MTARPFVKWAGGKSKQAERILSFMPSTIRCYYEPFVGGGAVFWRLLQDERFSVDSFCLSDANEDLMAVWNVLLGSERGYAELVDRLGSMEAKHRDDPKGYYYLVRGLPFLQSAPADMPARAARMVYLNRVCFNGLWRTNSKGEFNVPLGKYDHGKIGIVRASELNECRAQLLSRHALVHTGDFDSTALRGASTGDVAYFDPPYWPVSKTASFTSYQAGGFGPEHQKQLAKLCRYLAGRGVTVIASNADVPEVRQLYHGFDIHRVDVARAINSKGGKRGKVGELIMVANGRVPASTP